MSAAVDGLASATAAATRVAELQKMIAQVEDPVAASGDFSAQLASATAVPGQGSLAPGSAISSGATAGAGAAGVDASVPFASQINAAAAKYGIDPALLAGVIKAESNFDPNAGSPAGAQGLAQLMPETARSIGVKDPYNPTEAIEGGARILSEHLKTFGGDPELALAAYNAGAGAVQQYNGIPPYPETQAYVPRVLGFAEEFRHGAGG